MIPQWIKPKIKPKLITVLTISYRCSIWTRALHMYSTLLWYAGDVRSQLVLVVFILVLVLCDLQCLVLVAIVTIICGG